MVVSPWLCGYIYQLSISLLLFIGTNVSQLLPSSIISKILFKFDTKAATEIDFNTFQLGKHSFQFSVRNWNCKLQSDHYNVSTSLEPLLLGAVKILRHVTRYTLLREKESSLHILLIRAIVTKDRE